MLPKHQLPVLELRWLAQLFLRHPSTGRERNTSQMVCCCRLLPCIGAYLRFWQARNKRRDPFV